MKNIKELRKELVIMKELEIKPNYAELARKYNCDYRTVKKYHDGYEGKSKTRQRISKLDKYKEEISEKINKAGANKKGTFEYFKDKYNNVGSYSNFAWYIRTKKLITKNISKEIHPRLKLKWANNYSLIGRKILLCQISMEKYLSLIYFSLSCLQVDFIYLDIVRRKQEKMFKNA